MRGASRGSLTAAEQQLTSLLSSDSALPDPAVAGDELFAVTRLLDSNGSLRRALTDPSRDGESKAALLRQVLGSQVSDGVLDLLSGLVRHRWSAARDLSDTVEHLAVMSLVSAADRNGRLDSLEDDLFRFGRIIAADRPLQSVLTDRQSQVAPREALVSRLLEGKVGPETLRLARQSAGHPRGRNLAGSLEEYSKVAARYRQRLVAHVTAAVPLTEQQRQRLSDVLAGWYGHAVHLNVELDPEVLGGLRVQVGDEVIDSTVLARLHGARQQVAR